MSQQIAAVPLARVTRVQLYLNHQQKSLARIRQETGADYVLNGGLFNPNWTACALCKADGVLHSAAPWRTWGFGWDVGPDITLRSDHENVKNFLSCVCLLRDGKPQSLPVSPALDGARARSAVGLAGDRLVLFCTSEGTTPATLQRKLAQLGCTDALMLDGGGSSQCDFRGARITSPRIVQNLLLVYARKEGQPQPPHREEEPMHKPKIVCLDPGHGPGCVNGSPDGSYLEREFAWAMYTRLRPLLEARGIRVVGTRQADTMPSLRRRAQISDQAGADLFVSLHSNAAGNDGWYEPRGLMVYTSQPGESAPRNRAARAVLACMGLSGIQIHGRGLAHAMFTVLARSAAPAILIEYGFHTNRAETALLKDAAYRDKLAQATARGICEYLGVAWSGQDPEPPAPTDRQRVQARFGLSDHTMDYLEAYEHSAALLKKLAG